MSTTRTFTRNELEDLELPFEIDDEDGEIVSDTIVGKKRWSLIHKLVFRLNGMAPDEAYRVNYLTPATECQEQRAWESSEVTAQLVRLVERTVQVWEDA